ncbi:amidohydrolase [Rhodobacter aestuarii]|uniref:Amidohydrolase n=1 Tax=Rhodobacter aestuarii TaxID=453582 RepID=A0A1N7J1R0_9RHOB|nr:amidohydrolase [Rhodobacter aestuarii]PTV97289.1 amidohydrolase [Rhodobacter aestuarii]SIS43197.1 amidohydrolase [Rhodobacter aestuarii]
MRADILDPQALEALTAWRRARHAAPELSGHEVETARQVCAALQETRPDTLLSGLGGNGVAAVYEGAVPGPSVMIRCELDGLPIAEIGTHPHRSTVPGQGHLCGHDGHMAIVLGVARWLGMHRPARGRAILLFQPAEEDGSGAAAVLADPKFAPLRPDLALALHNYPGLPLGAAVVRDGVAHCASRGMKIVLEGRTAHAAQPDLGLSPGPVLARLIERLPGLSQGHSPEEEVFALVTVTHASLGAPSFGIAPGRAELWVTLRTRTDAGMQQLTEAVEELIAAEVTAAGLRAQHEWHDVFRHCENAPEAVAVFTRAMQAAGIPATDLDLPMRASEDFGRFSDLCPAAMLLLGAGEECAPLHAPDYDFPDALIEPGVALFTAALRAQLF